MLTILLPTWTGWTVGVLVAIAWLWAWALCRAAARGDEMICALHEDMARSAGDAGAELLLTPQRSEAAMASATIGFGEGKESGLLAGDERPLRAAQSEAMSRVSDLEWGIRWETVERLDGTPLYGALMPETYPSLHAARRAERQLQRARPVRSTPFRASELKTVRYVVFARNRNEPTGL